MGYLKVHALTEKDYVKLSGGFEKLNLESPDIKDSEVPSWIYFMADLYMLEFYQEKYKAVKKLKRLNLNPMGTNAIMDMNPVKIKYASLYRRIVEKHQYYYEKIISSHYKSEYKFLDTIDDESFLYDVMTINKNVILYDFLVLNAAKSNPYEKIVFCYKHFIEGWSSKLILDKLRKKPLNKLLIGFVNEYSVQSGLPQVAVLCYFYLLEEALYKKKMELTRLNMYFPAIELNEFLNRSIKEKRMFVNSVIDKRLNLMDKWCNRIRERILEDSIEILNNSKL